MTYIHFQYQIHTEPVLPSDPPQEDKWHQPWSEPRRFKRWPIMAASGYFGTLGAGTAETIFEDKWHFPWSEPKRFKRGLSTTAQQFIAFQPGLMVNVGWFEPLSEPKRSRRPPPLRLEAQLSFNIINITENFGWYSPFSEPKRFLKGVKAALQRELLRAEFIPFSYTATMDAIEQEDFLTAVLYEFNIPTHAYVDIIEKNPHSMANMGIIENVAEPSIVTGIIEPQTAPTSGSAVSGVASARVAIILT